MPAFRNNLSKINSMIGDCDAGFICFGGAEFPNPAQEVTWGASCRPGFYCPQGTKQEWPCKEGTYR